MVLLVTLLLQRAKHLNGLMFTRRISVGTKEIKIWIPSTSECCADECNHLADEQAMLAATLADQDDDCWLLAHKIVKQCACIVSAEVTDEIDGNGAIYSQQFVYEPED